MNCDTRGGWYELTVRVAPSIHASLRCHALLLWRHRQIPPHFTLIFSISVTLPFSTIHRSVSVSLRRRANTCAVSALARAQQPPIIALSPCLIKVLHPTTMSSPDANANATYTATVTTSNSSSSNSHDKPSSLPASTFSSSNPHRLDLNAAEYFDVLDEDGNPTGRVKLRKLVHADGDWHACVHIWVIHSDTGKVLMQRRSACKDSFPSCWDVSCAGHLAAGEGKEEAAISELREELGIEMPAGVAFDSFFRSLGTLPRAVISQGGSFIDREHTYIYVVEGRFSIDEMKLQREEVERVEWMEVEDIVRKFEEKDPTFVDVPDIATYRPFVFDKLAERVKQIRQR